MQFLGYEVNLSRTAAEPASKPRTKKGLEIGDSGTRILDGVVSEEYNSKLLGQKGIEIYDEMRKSDASVKAALSATTLPIRAATWYVEPASDEAKDQEIAEFVQKALMEWQSIEWEDLLRQALLSLPFGYMVFEKVYATHTDGGKTYVVWDKLAPRMPRSIQKWAIGSGSEPGVTQRKSDGTTVEIPMEKLVVIVHEKEGDNWEGTSILRPAYKHWYMKNTFYKIDAIAFERQGLGVPFAKLPENYTEADRSTAENILTNLRANSKAFILEPHDYEIGFKDMMAKTTRDPSSSIAHHNREILKSVLAQFLDLGSGAEGATGSRAVSQDHSELFLQAVSAVADTIANAFNKQAIKELVDLNFDTVEKYPVLTYTKLAKEDVASISAAYQTLSTAGAIIPTDNDEQYFRNMLGLPERDPDEDPGRKPETKEDIDPEDTTNSKKPKADDKEEMSELVAWLKKNSDRQSFAEDGTFKPYRKLTFAEEKVDFEALQRQMDKLEADFDTRTKELLHGAREEYMRALTKAALAGDTRAIKDATLKVQSDYARIIKQAVTAAYTYGKTNAAKEMGVAAPANPQEILRQIDIQSDTIADRQIAEIIGDSKNAYVQALNKGASVAVALAAADEAAQAAIDALTSDASAILMAGYINHGRNTVFTKNGDDIHALQRSEILDTTTCNFCLSVDGRVLDKGDSFTSNTIFHSNCRGIWVAIKTDEQELPSIGGVPKAIRDRFGDAVNDLVQPKRPIVRKDAPAAKEARRRIEQ